jgi:hypothetical protein
MRLIDADKLKEAFPARHNNKFVLIADVRAAINQAPEVDAVPVIRCRDCRYKYGSDCDNFAGVLVEDDYFCSMAERREVSE